MNIKTFVFFVFFGFASPSFAQVLIGPVAGLNYSWVKFGDKDNRDTFRVKSVVGFHAGVQLSFKVRKRFFLNTSLIYSQKGKIIEGRIDRLLRNEAKYNYIELPITYTIEFKNTIGRDKVFKWYLGMGPNLSYWLGGKGTLQNSDLIEVEIPKQSYRVVFNKANPGTNELNVTTPNRLQLGLNLSAGVAFEPGAGSQKILLTVRYEMGHTFLSKKDRGIFPNTITYQDELRTRNQGLRISLAYLFDLKTDQRKKGKSTFDKKKSRL